MRGRISRCVTQRRLGHRAGPGGLRSSIWDAGPVCTWLEPGRDVASRSVAPAVTAGRARAAGGCSGRGAGRTDAGGRGSPAPAPPPTRLPAAHSAGHVPSATRSVPLRECHVSLAPGPRVLHTRVTWLLALVRSRPCAARSPPPPRARS